jgi:PEP-CTERM motif-containing protein
MRFGKAIPIFGLLMVCFTLAAQSAKADRYIYIDDTSDTITVLGPANISCATANRELCMIILTPPTPVVVTPTPPPPPPDASSTSLPDHFLMVEGAGATVGSLVHASDGLNHLLLFAIDPTTGRTQNTLTFQSDPAIASDPTLVGSCVPNLVDCIIEDGLFHEAGTVTWTDGTVDHIQIASDAPEVPEPASLILFGSGLAIAGGFLRRRWGLVTPSV